MSLRFEWDPRKAKSNLAKHGVSFTEAITVFADPLARIFNDDAHSLEERLRLYSNLTSRQSFNPQKQLMQFCDP